MLKSSEVAYLIPSNYNNKSCILGIGKGFLLIILFTDTKSEMKRSVPFVLEIIKNGASYLELFLRFNTPMFINLLTFVFSFFCVFLELEKVWHSMVWFLLKA